MDYGGFEFEPGQRIVIYGETGMGKTYTFTQMLGKIRETIPNMIVCLIAPNYEEDKTYEKAREEYKRVSHGGNLIDIHYATYNDQAKSFLNGIIDRRRNQRSISRKRGRPTRRNRVDKRTILIALDDVGEDHRVNRTYVENAVKKMALSARHLNIMMVMMYQYMSQTMVEFGHSVQMVVSKKLLGEKENRLFREMYLPEHSKEEYDRLRRMVFRERWDTLVIDRRDPGHLRIFRNFAEEVRVREVEHEF
ncbi:hypothetical protein KAU11_11685 [Candidatus Babeliales bacterium]|nr:hypothetical protein [Candidatus Babeliales bacterium]